MTIPHTDSGSWDDFHKEVFKQVPHADEPGLEDVIDKLKNKNPGISTTAKNQDGPLLAGHHRVEFYMGNGRFGVTDILGRGGMGKVYLAWDYAENRRVAIKTMADHLVHDDKARRSFATEANALAAIRHENVVRIHPIGETADPPYLVMPYLHGQTLQKKINDSGRLALKSILRIGMQVASGLAAVYKHGLIHRDVKPSNIFLHDGVDRAILIDFGLVRVVDAPRVTTTGVIAGTVEYMSPEQADGKPVNHRTDLYSLGVTLYQACVGHPPFQSDNKLEVLRQIREEEPTPIQDCNPDVPVRLVEIINKLMAKDADERYQSAEEVEEEFRQYLCEIQEQESKTDTNQMESAMPTSNEKAQSLQNQMRTMQLIAIAAAILLVVTGGTLAYVMINANQNNGNTEHAKGPETVGPHIPEKGNSPVTGGDDPPAPALPKIRVDSSQLYGPTKPFSVKKSKKCRTVN